MKSSHASFFCRAAYRLAMIVASGTGAAAPLAFDQAPPSGQVSAMAPMPVTVYGGAAAGRTLALVTSYDSRDWTGTLRAWPIDSASGALAGQPLWDSATQLDAVTPAARTMLTHDGRVGRPLRWSSLEPGQQSLLADGGGEPAGRDRVDWLRGDHRHEIAHGGTLRNRIRWTDGKPFRQADIAGSPPWPVGRPVTRMVRPADPGYASWRTSADIAGRSALVYVAANDGFLQGFDAADGRERLAYLPAGLLPFAPALSRPRWAHRRLFDGPVFAADADIRPAGASASRWATVLAGAPGAGAPGYFVLDISLPDQFDEARAEALVLLDTTATRDPDIGHIFSPASPDERGTGAGQITRLNDGRWALVLGNGVNSTGEMPVLLIQYLDGARELLRIAPTCPPAPAACPYRGGNGLSAPALIDVDGNGSADIAYAGDLLGHLWKYDLSETRSADWKIAFGGAPFFTAVSASGRYQPISAAPAWMPHPSGGVMLALGTGRLLTAGDRTDTGTQTLYGLHDDSKVRITPATPARSGRITVEDSLPVNARKDRRPARTLLVLRLAAGSISQGGRRYERTEIDRAGIAPGAERGWRMDLPAAGERMLQTPRALGGRQLLFTSTDGAAQWFTVLDALGGRAPAAPTFTALAELPAPAPASGVDPRTANRTAADAGGALALLRGAEWRLLAPGLPQTDGIVLRRGGGKPLRAGWRQLR